MLELHAYIDVSDMERGIDFYCGGLDLEVHRRLSPTWTELKGAAIPVFLLVPAKMTANLGTTTVQRIWERHWTPVHLDFVVADIDLVVQRLLDRGATLSSDIKNREYGRIANMGDPFGNGFDLIEFSGDGYEVVDRN